MIDLLEFTRSVVALLKEIEVHDFNRDSVLPHHQNVNRICQDIFRDPKSVMIRSGSGSEGFCPTAYEYLSLSPTPMEWNAKFADPVNHPAHYGGADNPFEAIKVIEAWELNFCLGNAVKYISRAGKKGAALEDLKKARWYLDREIQKRESDEPK